MSFVEESFPVWERIHRPLCPGKVSKALLRCIQKLDSVSATAGRSPLRGSSELTTVAKASLQHGEADGNPGPAPATADLQLLSRHYDAETAFLPAPSAAESPEMFPFPAARECPTPVFSAQPSSDERRKPRVLLVEDNIINLKLLQTFMVKYGAQKTETAENGMAAINAVKQHAAAFDVIFMDMSMPGVDGFEATRAIRQLEREGPQPSPPASNGHMLTSEPSSAHPALIIALTGLASAKDQDEAYKAGVDIVLTKPARFGKLAELLAQWEQGELVGGGKGGGQV